MRYKNEKIYNYSEILSNSKTIDLKIVKNTVESNNHNNNSNINTTETSTIPITTLSPSLSTAISTSIESSLSKKILPSLQIESLLPSNIEISHNPKSPLKDMLEVEEGKIFEQNIEKTEYQL